jgi:hypothetical protein
LKKQYLEGRMRDYLARRSPPQSISKNERALTDELAAILRAVVRAAPDQGFQEWWPRFEDNLDRSLKTRAWPTVFEINSAAPKTAEKKTEAGHRGSLSSDELHLLETKVLPTARRWLEIPGLAHHGRQTLEYWGEL